MCLATSSSKSVPSKEVCSTTDGIVPTFPVEPAPQQLDITDLTSSDLARLRRDDPFMYYSIPSVNNAALHLENVSATALHSPSSQHSSETKSNHDNASTKQMVTRQRRLSLECHHDSFMEEMLAGDDFKTTVKQPESDKDDGDDLYYFLLTLGKI